MFKSTNTVFRMRPETDAQQDQLQAIQDKKETDWRAIRNKYSPDTFYRIQRELDLIFYKFAHNILALDASAPNLITSMAKPHALMQSIFESRNSYSQYIKNIELIIGSTTSLLEADQNWYALMERHSQFNDSWSRDTEKFIQEYTYAIATLQNAANAQPSTTETPSNLNLEQKLSNALQQLLELEVFNNQPQKENKSTKNKFKDLKIKIIKTVETSVNQAKLLKENNKIEIIRIKLENFIDQHPEIDGLDELVDILGSMQQPTEHDDAI